MKKTIAAVLTILAIGAFAAEPMSPADYNKARDTAGNLLKQGKPAEAREIYTELVAATPANNTKREMQIRVTLCYLAENNLDEAAKSVEQAKSFKEKIHPNTIAGTDIAEARLLIARKEYDQAIALLQEVLKRNYLADLFHSEADYYIGEALLAKGQKPEAKAAFEKALTSKRQWPEVTKQAKARLEELK